MAISVRACNILRMDLYHTREFRRVDISTDTKPSDVPYDIRRRWSTPGYIRELRNCGATTEREILAWLDGMEWHDEIAEWVS